MHPERILPIIAHLLEASHVSASFSVAFATCTNDTVIRCKNQAEGNRIPAELTAQRTTDC